MNDNKIVNREAIRKYKSRENETPDQRETRLIKQCEKRCQKKAVKTYEEWDAHHTYEYKWKCQRLINETDQQYEKYLEYYRKLRSQLKL